MDSDYKGTFCYAELHSREAIWKLRHNLSNTKNCAMEDVCARWWIGHLIIPADYNFCYSDEY